MRETLRQRQNAVEVDDKVRLALEAKESNRRVTLQQHVESL